MTGSRRRLSPLSRLRFAKLASRGLSGHGDMLPPLRGSEADGDVDGFPIGGAFPMLLLPSPFPSLWKYFMDRRTFLAVTGLGFLASQRADAAEPVTHRFLAADKGHICVVGSNGKVEWEAKCAGDVHDLSLLPNGNVLFPMSSTEIVEMNPAKEVVWRYESKPKEGNKDHVEVHAFQRLENGHTMIAESGNGRIIEVDVDGKIQKEIPLTLEHPNAHRDTRMARKIANGNYLVCHEGDGAVREYDDTGKVVWTYKLDLAGRPRSGGHGPEGHGTEVFGAIRLQSGNTLIAAGNGNRVIEVDPEGQTVWSVEQKELPGITLAWVTSLHALPDGNIIIGNCHAGPENPQLIEVTRDKQVVWQMLNFQTFGNGLAASHIVDVPGVVR